MLLKRGVGAALLLTCAGGFAAEPATGPVELCVTRNDVAHAGVKSTYLGLPAAIVQNTLDAAGCTRVEETKGPYAWLVDASTAPMPPYRGPLSVCMSRNAVPEAGKTVAVLVPPNTQPLLETTGEDGCAAFPTFNGVYVMFTSNLERPERPSAAARRTRD